MKVGIVVHSLSGHTYSVAEKLRDKLIMGGNRVEVKKIEPVGGESNKPEDLTKITFNPAPNVKGFDALVFCAPVRGFSISPVLSAYIASLDTIKGQKVDLFVTQFFPYPWMGGNQAIAQMKSICEKKGAIIGCTGIINWKNKKRVTMIEDVVNRISSSM